MQQEFPDPSPVVIKAASSAIAKSVLYISIAIVGIVWINHRKLDGDIIAECESACGTTQGIREVTSTSCECGEADGLSISGSPFVLPR